MTGFVARAIVKGAVEIAEGVAAGSKTLGGTSEKLAAQASELLTARTVSPIVKEAGGATASGAEKLVATVGSGERQTLTLSAKIAIPGGTAREAVSKTSGVGSSFVPRQFSPHGQNRVMGFSEAQSSSYISGLESSQEAILRHNMLAAKNASDSMGKFAQSAIFPHLKARFDSLVGNSNLKLFATQDLSAADHVGADYMLVRSGLKNAQGLKESASVFPVDVKALGTIDRVVPTARARGVLDYPTEVFRKVGDKWELNDRALSFNQFINKSAETLAGMAKHPMVFDLARHPMPFFRLEAPGKAAADISRFRQTLLQSTENHLPAYGDHLKGALKHLDSAKAQQEFAAMSRLR